MLFCFMLLPSSFAYPTNHAARNHNDDITKAMLQFSTCLHARHPLHKSGDFRIKALNLYQDCANDPKAASELLPSFPVVYHCLEKHRYFKQNVRPNPIGLNACIHKEVHRSFQDLLNSMAAALTTFLVVYSVHLLYLLTALIVFIATSCGLCAFSSLDSSCFKCFKCFYPFCAVISVEGYGDRAALASMYCCCYTLFCWKPAEEDRQVEPNTCVCLSI